MTKYFTQWDSDTIGSTEAGWTQLGGATTAHVPAYASTTANPIKRRYSALTPGGSGAFEFLQHDASAADANRANFDICTMVLGSLCTATTVTVAYARGQGTGTITDYYGISLVLSTGVVTLVKRVASVNTNITTGTDATTITPSSNFFVRFRGNGTTLQVRVWAASLGMAGEPTTWLINTTDSSLSAAGWIARRGFGSGLVTALAFWAVGTNGDSAPCPRTNTEYTAWLDSQSAIRCVLAEMSATGYDSGGSPYTKTVNVYLSNHGYTSQQQDTPSLRHYDNYIQQIPTFTREMSTALSGQATTGFGDLIISNPVETIASGGVRDNWLRMKWNRNYLKLYLGDPSWPKHDFRLMIYGRVGMPSAPTLGQIKFPIADLSDFFNAPIVTSVFSSGQYLDQIKPKLLGTVQQLEPPLTDTSTLTYTIDNGSLSSAINDARDDGVAIGTGQTLSISAVNAGTGDITSNSHGMIAGYRLQWVSGTPPLGMSLSTDYWVIAAGLTTNVFRLSATMGGAAITGGGTGITGQFVGYGFYFTLASGTMTLVASPAGRVTVGATDATGYPDDLVNEVAFNALGMSLNFKDAATFSSLRTDYTGKGISGGLWLQPGRNLATDVLPAIARGFNIWYGFTSDALLQVGALGLPAATAVASFTESDVVAGSLRLVDVIRPIDFSVTPFSYQPWFLTGGPIQTGLQESLQGKTFLSAYSYGAASTPLDNYPASSDANRSASFDTLVLGSTGATALRADMVALYLSKLGIFEFTTRLSAFNLNIGDTISLTHPRYHWKQWTGADDASPDNTATVDSRLAVVIGIATDVAKGQTKIKCFRRIPGYYPTADLN